MERNLIHDEDSIVVSLAGSVAIVGPDGVKYRMSPMSAARTGQDMIEKASEAVGKQAINDDARRRDLEPPYSEK